MKVKLKNKETIMVLFLPGICQLYKIDPDDCSGKFPPKPVGKPDKLEYGVYYNIDEDWNIGEIKDAD